MEAPTPISLCAVIIRDGAKLIVDEYERPELYVSLTQLRRPFPMPLNTQPRQMHDAQTIRQIVVRKIVLSLII